MSRYPEDVRIGGIMPPPSPSRASDQRNGPCGWRSLSPDYRGRAIEPIIRDSVARLLPIDEVDAHTVAGYWTRDGRTEVDLVGVDRRCRPAMAPNEDRSPAPGARHRGDDVPVVVR